MNDEQVRRRLMTTLSAAVRLGRAGALPDNVVAAELSDLADLYLAAVVPVRFPPIKQEDLWPGPPESATPQDEAAPAVCGFELEDIVGITHVHRCQKAPGHADGPGGSDHQCGSCGVLYDATGGAAAPLGVAGLPLGGNGPTPDAEEIEL